MSNSEPMQPARPAATLVIMRDRLDAPSELLMVRRSSKMSFAGGAMVFPGGAVDDADRAFAAKLDHDLDPDDAAARIAAIRESVEEAGVAIGLAGLAGLASAMLPDLRAMLHEGRTLEEALGHFGQRPDMQALTPFARWRPNFKETRLFDTRFYLATMPAGAPEPVVDATENEVLLWSSAADMLAKADRDEAHIIFPTRRTLERLAQFDDHAAMRDHALSIPVRMITPWVEERGGKPHLCIPDDMGYPTCAEPLESAMRG